MKIADVLKNKVLTHILLTVAWVAVFVLLPHIVWSIGKTWTLVPYFYIYTTIITYVIFIISNSILRKKKYILFVAFCVVSYTVCELIKDAMLANIKAKGFISNYITFNGLFNSKALFVFVMIYLSVLLVAVANHIIKLREERKKLVAEKLKAELSLLKTQINPHFFFNSLNSIYHLALTKDERAPDAIITLSDMMRYVLTDAKHDFVDISKEVEYLEKYIELQKNRLPHTTKLNYSAQIEGSYNIAPLLLISFYENAFKYGVSATYPTEIKIHLSVAEGKLHLTTHNCIFKNSENRYGTASGISNVVRRLELLFSNKYSINIDESAEEYTVNLTIDLK